MYRLFVLLLLKDLAQGLGNNWAFFIRDVIHSLLRIINEEKELEKRPRHRTQEIQLVVDSDLFLPCCNLLYYVCKAAVECCSQVRWKTVFFSGIFQEHKPGLNHVSVGLWTNITRTFHSAKILEISFRRQMEMPICVRADRNIWNHLCRCSLWLVLPLWRKSPFSFPFQNVFPVPVFCDLVTGSISKRSVAWVHWHLESSSRLSIRASFCIGWLLIPCFNVLICWQSPLFIYFVNFVTQLL